MTRPPLRPTLLPSPPPARSEEARRRPRPGAGPAPRRVVGACIRPAHRAVRGDPVEGDFMIAPREPAERDHAIRRDGLAGRAVHPDGVPVRIDRARDRKSTRLNSSHLVISYAVFCLKKKNQQIHTTCTATEI